MTERPLSENPAAVERAAVLLAAQTGISWEDLDEHQRADKRARVRALLDSAELDVLYRRFDRSEYDAD